MAIQRFDGRYGCAALAWCAVILGGSITPDPPGKEFLDLPMADKLVHFCGYALLCWLVGMSMRKARRPYGAVPLIIVPVVFSVAFGVLNEILQMSVEARSYEVADVAADALGAVVAQSRAGYVHFRRRRVSS